MTDRRMVAVVVEDDDGVRLLLDAILRTEGWGRVLGATWEEVRDATGAADVLLVDHQLPGTQGIDVVAEVRTDRPALKVVMLTGDRSIRDRAEHLGVDGFLLKPFDVPELIDILRDVTTEAGDEAAGSPAEVDLREAPTSWFSAS